jgi:hypothetical protein
MKTWNPDASEHFESWLGSVRRSVADDPTINPDDLAQDLRAHVHAELEAAPEPVTKGALDRVLESLGTPTQWSDSVTPPRSPATVRFYTGTSDTFTGWQQKLAGDAGKPVLLFVLALVAIPTFDELIGVPLLAFAYFVARSHLTYAKDELVGARKWMIYFPLAVGAGVLAGLVLAFPLILVRQQTGFEALWLLGSWWVLVGLVAAREPKPVRAALKPFAGTFDVSHGRMLSLIGAAFLIAAIVVGFDRL